MDVNALSAPASHSGSSATEDEVIALTRRVASLEETVEHLRAQLQNLHEQLGLSQPGQG
ncbi:hypothetical protein Y695_02744 [Hydrogenophaga sp. T4]|nr:hypothetical protein Y695_02744 [Hydrogenophaga sp. T4]